MASRDSLNNLFLSPDAGSRRLLPRCAVAAILLVAACYPDIIFGGASLSLANLVNVTRGPSRQQVQFLPERKERTPRDGYVDNGGAAFQSEPAAQFVTRALWGGHSLYWNPYSATGSFGLETLVDVKTSPITMFEAALGGGDAALHLAYLTLMVFGVFCLLVLFTIELKLSLLAALVGGVAYLLNGYFVANLASNVSQAWLYFPVLVLGLVGFARAPRVSAFLFATAGAAMLAATTFLPTTIVVIATTMVVGAAAALAFSVMRSGSCRDSVRRTIVVVTGQSVAVLLAFLALSAAYLPIFEAMRYMATSEFYAQRIFYPATFVNFVTLFTPKHAFEAYGSIPGRALALAGNWAFHQGIVTALLLLQLVRRWSPFHRILLLALGGLLLVLLARVYGVPGIGTLIDQLSVLGHVGEQYLWIGIAELFTLLLPFGFEAVLQDGVRPTPLLLGALLIGGSMTYTAFVYGIHDGGALFHLAVALGLIVSTIAILLLWRLFPTALWPGLTLFLLSWTELTFYVDHMRYARTERFLEPPPMVQFLQRQASLHRIASFGPWGIPPEYGSAYGIYQIDSMNFQLFPRYEKLFNRLVLPDPKDRWPTFATLETARDIDGINLWAYDFLGARFLIISAEYPRLRAYMEGSGWRRSYADGVFIIFENPNPMPRAFITHRLARDSLTPIDRGEAPLSLATSDDETLLVEAQRNGIGEGRGPPPSEAETAVITYYDNDQVEITANVKSPGILVLNDAWHPNWTVSIDGSPGRIGRVDEVFRGVVLQPGHHVVEMRYAPHSLPAGRLISGLVVLLVALMVTFRRRLDPALWRMAEGRTRGYAWR